MILHPDVTHKNTIRRFETLESDLYEIWGDKLDFTESVYSGSRIKMKYYCNTHKKHYDAEPRSLLDKQGCPDCGRDNTNANNKLRSLIAENEFPAKAEAIHPNKYLYHLVKYIETHSKVEIWCISCDNSFWITPRSLLSGSGCKCHAEIKLLDHQYEKKKKAGVEFPAKAELIHPRKNYYHLVDYINATTKVTLWCVGCDVSYEILPNSCLGGQGHSGCAKYGFNPEEPAILYYIRVESFNQLCWKIGITNKTVSDRFIGSDLDLITIISIRKFENGSDARDEEQRLLELYKDNKYTGDPLLYRGGNTELFTKDVLNLDKGQTK